MKILRKTILAVLIFTLMLSNFAFGQQPQEMTRVSFTKEILKIMDVEIDKGLEIPFNDIKNKADIPYIATAANKKVISGHGGAFYPEAPVTREQAVIMLVRALGVININQDEASKAQLSFSDAKQISSWAKPYISYAVKYGIIEDSQGQFNPQKGITKLEGQEMLNKFKDAFIRDGLTAAQVLQLADGNLKKLNTYKFKGIVDMTTSVKVPTEGVQIVTSKVVQEGIFEAPETVYTISKDTSSVAGQTVKTVSEVYMKDGIMYIRNGEGQEWMKMDLNPMMAELQSLMGGMSGIGGGAGQGSPQFSNEELEAIGMYARYGKDIEIDGQKYYVIKVDLDHEAFMEMYTKIMDQTFEYMFEGEMWEEMKKDPSLPKGSDAELKSMIKSMAKQTLQNMKIEMMQEYYIHKESKAYSKLMVKQTMNMNLMEVETKMDMNGEYEYYGFNEKVIFPEIN